MRFQCCIFVLCFYLMTIALPWFVSCICTSLIFRALVIKLHFCMMEALRLAMEVSFTVLCNGLKHFLAMTSLSAQHLHGARYRYKYNHMTVLPLNSADPLLLSHKTECQHITTFFLQFYKLFAVHFVVEKQWFHKY